MNKVFDPRLIAGDDVWEFGVHIRKRDLGVTKPAVLFTGDVAPIDGAVSVIVCLTIDQIR